MEELRNLITFCNNNEGFLTVLLTLALVLATVVYVVLTYRMSNASQHATLQMQYEHAEEAKAKDLTKNNILHLLNAEIYMNSTYYVLTLFYLQNFDEINLKEKMNMFKRDGTTSVEKLLKSQMIHFASSDLWNQIKGNCIYYLSNKLMKELAGYYSGISRSTAFSIEGMSRKDFIEFAKGQLVSSFKCFRLMDNEAKEQLRRDSVYSIDDKSIKVDPHTGDLIEMKTQ